MASQSQFLGTPRMAAVHIGGTGNNSNTSRNGSAGIGTPGADCFLWITAGASGGRIDNFVINAAGTVATTTAGCVRIWAQKSADTTTNFRLLEEIVVTAVVPSASAKGFSFAATGRNYILEAGEKLYITSQILDTAGNQFDIIETSGGDF